MGMKDANSERRGEYRLTLTPPLGGIIPSAHTARSPVTSFVRIRGAIVQISDDIIRVYKEIQMFSTEQVMVRRNSSPGAKTVRKLLSTAP